MKRRNSRQDAIREIVRGKTIRTQRGLVDELQAMGYACTQATVSRDIADMGLRKLPEGVYVLAEDLHGLIRSLEIPQAEKDRLLAMTPASYIGKAAELAKRC